MKRGVAALKNKAKGERRQMALLLVGGCLLLVAVKMPKTQWAGGRGSLEHGLLYKMSSGMISFNKFFWGKIYEIPPGGTELLNKNTEICNPQ